MNAQPLDSLIAELASDDWLEVSGAVHKLFACGDAAPAVLPKLFELARHEKAPIASDSRRLIKKLGRLAVPFLRDVVRRGPPEERAIAIALLTETGSRWATSTRLAVQILDPRCEDLPDWGVDPEAIFALFRRSLVDDDLSARFNAACALEEFGRHLPETVPVFREVLRSGTHHQQNWAALHLGRIGTGAAGAVDELTAAAQSDCEDTALAAANALRRIAAV